MQAPDLINGLFEYFGSVAIWLSVVRIWRDKMVRGYSPAALAFFAAWGYWNLFYYPHLHQWLSFAGGVSMVAANSVYVILTLIYRNN